MAKWKSCPTALEPRECVALYNFITVFTFKEIHCSVHRENSITTEMEQLCKLRNQNLENRLQDKEECWAQNNKGSTSQKGFFQCCKTDIIKKVDNNYWKGGGENGNLCELARQLWRTECQVVSSSPLQKKPSNCPKNLKLAY